MIDKDGDNSITRLELKHFIISKHGDGPIHDEVDELVEIIMDRLDVDANGTIDRNEFTSRSIRWLRVIEHYPHGEHDVRKCHALQRHLLADRIYFL